MAKKLARDFGDFLVRTVGHYGYLIGTRGQKCTASLIQQAWNNYPSYRPAIDAYAKQWLVGNPDEGISAEEGVAWKVVDCMGWFECFNNGGDIGNPLTLSEMINGDVNTGMVYQEALNQRLPNGDIGTLPKDCPFPINVGLPGHVGFFHKGKVYQSVGHKRGTVISLLSENNWDYWYVNPYLDYEGWFEGGYDDMILEKGVKGQGVYNYQIICKKLNQPIGAFDDMVLKDSAGAPLKTGCDGSFGNTMVTVTNNLNTKYGFPRTTTGIVTDELMGKLNAELQALSVGVPLTQYDLVVKENTSLKAQVVSLNTQLTTEKGKVASLAAELEAEKAKVTKLTADLATANTQISKLKADIVILNNNITVLKEQLLLAQQKVAALTLERDQKEKELQDIAQDIRDVIDFSNEH